MNYYIKYLSFIASIFPVLILFSQNLNSIVIINLNPANETQNYNLIDEGLDGAPGLFILIILAFSLILISIGIGIVLAILILLIIFGLIFSGILSASIMVGLNNKSFTKGFKTFVISSTTFGGLILGIFGFWIINKITHWWSLSISLTIGSFCGLISGILFGYFLFYIIQNLTTFLNTKLKMMKLKNNYGRS